MVSIAPKIGCTPETLRTWVRQSETIQGIRGGMSSLNRDRLKELERENQELKRDKLLECDIQRVWDNNFKSTVLTKYGGNCYVKVFALRCTVEHLKRKF